MGAKTPLADAEKQKFIDAIILAARRTIIAAEDGQIYVASGWMDLGSAMCTKLLTLEWHYAAESNEAK